VHVPGGFHQSVHAFIVNEAKWKALSAEDQSAVSKLTGEHLARLWGSLWDKTNADAVEQMRKEGVQIHDASAALLADLRERLATLETDWIADATKKGVDGKAALAYLREQVKELERK
jgi:TRAP-type C4-dicarboxylate transport system substrate-binding protein